MNSKWVALITIVVIALAIFSFGYVPARASLKYGAPAAQLSISQRIDYSTRLLAYGDELFIPLDSSGVESVFEISSGESAYSVAERLQQNGIISNAQAFVDYLVYSGLDLTLQSGVFRVSPALSMIDVAKRLQNLGATDIPFVILSGWRMEEIAASLPTSGLDFSSDAFFSADVPPQILGLAPDAVSMEGFFLPDTYILPRSTTPDQLLEAVALNFFQHITQEMLNGFSAQGLNVYQAVTLSSIVERESIHDDEQALIASVFINRLNNGWTLGSDPTVQYALGYDLNAQTWWKNPLSLADLKYDSPYNTYIYAGLPPAPISNPDLSALQSVAFPANSPYFYFRSKCDNSGYHVFALTLEEQISNACP